jgi:hypothetical protein
MASHKLPFENRRTSGRLAWEWYCELERLGLNNVRTMFVDHEIRHPGERLIVTNIPAEFVRDWLAFHDRRAAHRESLWRVTVVVLALVAASAAVVAALQE